MERFFQRMVVGVAVCLICFAFGGLALAAEPQYTLRYALNQPITHNCTIGAQMFAKLVGEKTGGKVKIEVYPMGQLFSDRDMPTVIPTGALDIGSSLLALWTGKTPVALASDLCMFYKDGEHHIRFHDSPGGDILKTEIEKKGVKFIHWYGSTASCYFVTNKPIFKAEDLKGLRLRAPTEILAVTVKSMGAAPTMLSAGELYFALQKGILDGTISSPPSIIDRKLYEVTKYLTYFPGLAYTNQWVLMNKNKWDSLPVDIQRTILEAGQETQKWWYTDELKRHEEALVFLKKANREPYTMSITEMKKLQKAALPEVTDYFQKRAGDLGKKVQEEAEKGGFTF